MGAWSKKFLLTRHRSESLLNEALCGVEHNPSNQGQGRRVEYKEGNQLIGTQHGHCPNSLWILVNGHGRGHPRGESD
ncbi:Hypothetical protein SMAX5B_006271 [Scophthalmus maximus]|uniref:Uncharacterized protein n=1 Tax=Scophthalmus maximus TaxID=52904 RepID=A0A2U9BJA8_SCOMX|nr:Hypothetical protein SMAX5B_006271 [Scophthalmus maximus]